ncbi:hypothetical protein W97_03944 [Coniosporium apollinis CBS 100218]|uniref:Disintegrin and metalloproteinase domain-containing protein B n=1 Tax=Coniosporium apollinis (strain CBS 100218) TaxID=1168221 RepID=R7YST9_CONA1|nr:uncharacterized protein W97_03944 [Coniosporium apollinis CBS 100218]EON64711.1 hypothetical protein W97_03944 [Coniosporium apollinis CBS 100218]
MHFLWPLVATVIASVTTRLPFASADSTSRNPITNLAVVKSPDLHTPNHRVTALSTFDLSFDVFDRRIKLVLEPNHDIIQDGATVEYLGPDGQVRHREVIDRLEHKVYKGAAWARNGQREWTRTGWARITVRRDGIYPLFEGAFTIDHIHHHVQMSSNYMQTRHALDPELVLDADDFMVVWRDSDIAGFGQAEHSELKRDLGLGGLESRDACQSDRLDFNIQPDHPVHKMLRRDDSYWSTPVESLFSKRQNDGIPGSGNSAGVNLVSTIGQTLGCPSTRKVALVGVATDCTYTSAFNSTETARQNVINQINSASDLYESTFNITLGLQNLTVSDATCPGSASSSTPWNIPCSGNTNIQDRLNLFSQWRGERQDSNSHWTLLTTCNTGSAVGLAWLGQACIQGVQNSSSSGSQEFVSGANVVVRTASEWQVIAHETGHTFGAVHDCTSYTCGSSNTVSAQQCCPLSAGTCDAGAQYIMNPSTAGGIARFSPCSIGNICSAFGRNSVKSDCFTNNRDVTTISGQMCGNGIVEEGEECDCGGPEGCGDNACCEPATCQFRAGAVCDDANEDCCRGCQLASAETVCRPSTGVCDPQETCSGSSSYCPADNTNPDGESCGDGLSCASGQCTSRDLQCKTVMGSYTRGNDTYACDSSSCMLTCASPEFGPGICYGLQQNFLDGTDCAGGGKCQNGQCRGASFTGAVGSWIDDNLNVVIGIAAGVGGLIVIIILSCLISCFRRRRRRGKRVQPPQGWQGQHRGHSGRSVQMGQMPPPQGGQQSGQWYGPAPPQPAYARQSSVRYA